MSIIKPCMLGGHSNPALTIKLSRTRSVCLMRNRKSIEDLITSSLTEILKRSFTLERKDQIAIFQEFKEWINGENKDEDIWFLYNQIK